MLIKLIEEYKKILPGLRVVEKKRDKLSRFLAKILFFTNYIKTYSSFSLGSKPKVYLPDREGPWSSAAFEHEMVHSMDQGTFFGLLKWMPRLINNLLFNLSYIFPQCLVVLVLLTPLSWWFLLALLALLPLPSPFRAWAELRGYRRSIELRSSPDLDEYVKKFTGKGYYFMWPFKKHVRKLLQKSSPYKKLQDDIRKKVISS